MKPPSFQEGHISQIPALQFLQNLGYAFQATEEFSVQRAGSHEHYRPDIVLFVNDIPLVAIECKRPDIKEPISQAISQHLRNQQEAVSASSLPTPRSCSAYRSTMRLTPLRPP